MFNFNHAVSAHRFVISDIVYIVYIKYMYNTLKHMFALNLYDVFPRHISARNHRLFDVFPRLGGEISSRHAARIHVRLCQTQINMH